MKSKHVATSGPVAHYTDPSYEEMCKYLQAQIQQHIPHFTVTWLDPKDYLEAISNGVGGLYVKIPKPEIMGCLFVAMHEIGHMALKHFKSAQLDPKNIERQASLWARKQIEANGWQIHKDTWETAEAMWRAQQIWLDHGDKVWFMLTGEKVSNSPDVYTVNAEIEQRISLPSNPTLAEPL